jgi:hypothetical protein
VIRNWKSGNWRVEIRNWKIETGKWKLENGIRDLSTRVQLKSPVSISNFKSQISNFGMCRG